MSGGEEDLKVEGIRGGVRDLKIDAAAMWGGLKTKEAAAKGGGDRDYQNLKLHSVAIGEGFHELWIGEGDRHLKTKMKDAGGSEGADTLKRKPWEEKGAILKMRKEASTAMENWFRVQSPARMARKDAQKAQQAALGAGKKKMKVVKSKLPTDLIEHMAASPFTVCKDLSDESLAQKSPYYREVYAAVKIYEAKFREYWNVLMAQQREMGYAEDEIEVTDDEEEEAVVKN